MKFLKKLFVRADNHPFLANLNDEDRRDPKKIYEYLSIKVKEYDELVKNQPTGETRLIARKFFLKNKRDLYEIKRDHTLPDFTQDKIEVAFLKHISTFFTTNKAVEEEFFPIFLEYAQQDTELLLAIPALFVKKSRDEYFSLAKKEREDKINARIIIQDKFLFISKDSSGDIKDRVEYHSSKFIINTANIYARNFVKYVEGWGYYKNGKPVHLFTIVNRGNYVDTEYVEHIDWTKFT